jgi:hypothetical protein
MGPVSMIVTALVAGAVAATKDVATQAVKDGYEGLKTLIVRKFGEKADVVNALENVEKKPDSEARKAVLKEELETAGASQDAEVVQKAQALLDLLKEHGLAYHAEVHGSGAIAAGARGVAAGRDIRGRVITGDSNVVGDQARMGDKEEERE